MELNPFENSFATKDLLNRQLPRNIGFSDSASASGASTHSNNNNIEALSTSTAGKPSVSKPKTVIDGDTAQNPSVPTGVDPAAANGSNNKHNLRILNFLSLDSDRLPGLTPPIFTPGGRRLPPIQFSPGAPLGSPGTPGHLWSSLLNATNGTHAGPEAIPQFVNMLRKLGLTPNESNLRSGLTPSILAQQGFNFNLNTPGGFPNGQMTPGLLNLLGLTSTAPTETVPALSAQPYSVSHIQQPVNVAKTKVGETRAELPIQEEGGSDDSEQDAVVKQEQLETVKRPAAENGSTTKRAKPAAKGKAGKKKEETKKSARAASEDEKRKQFLERNRVAASKCRQRKKQLFSKMESELSFYSNGYRELSAQVTQLREQLLQVRGILTNHRDCPGLINSVGGYQQMQNVLGQTDFVAQVAANAQPAYTSIPTTIPTTLNAQPMKSDVSSNGLVASVDVHPMPEMNHINGQLHGQVGLVQQTQQVGQVGQIGGVRASHDQVPFQDEVDAGSFQGDISNGILNHGGALRPISSTSNLQSEKLVNDSYGLRPVASMADLQNGAQQSVVKHYDI